MFVHVYLPYFLKKNFGAEKQKVRKRFIKKIIIVIKKIHTQKKKPLKLLLKKMTKNHTFLSTYNYSSNVVFKKKKKMLFGFHFLDKVRE